MPATDDRDYLNDDENKPTCPICQGTGFNQGKICICISGLGDDEAVETLMNLFGMKGKTCK